MAESKITVLVPEELRRNVKAAAAQRGETVSQVVRTALEEYVAETKAIEAQPQAALRHDSLLSWRFSGGPGDVSERVDERHCDAFQILP